MVLLPYPKYQRLMKIQEQLNRQHDASQQKHHADSGLHSTDIASHEKITNAGHSLQTETQPTHITDHKIITNSAPSGNRNNGTVANDKNAIPEKIPDDSKKLRSEHGDDSGSKSANGGKKRRLSAPEPPGIRASKRASAHAARSK